METMETFWEVAKALGQVGLFLLFWLALFYMCIVVPLMESSPSRKEERDKKE